jgi:delta24-sterol reductase
MHADSVPPQKCLYAHAYYTEEEFWDIYDEGKYKGLRTKYHAESLPSVYGKRNVPVRTGLETY